MLTVFFVLLSLFSFAQELTTNPLILAIAQGCGDKVYDLEEVEQINELARCYQVAVKELPRRQATPIQMAYLTCGEFKQNDLRRLTCLRKFQESIQDKDLGTLLKKCPKEEEQLVKCLTTKKENCSADSIKIMQCYDKAKATFPTSTGNPYRLSVADNSYINTVVVGCGDSKTISSSSINADEVEGQVNCYQTGMLGLEKRMPNTAKLSIDLCANFKLYSQKVECFKNIAYDLEAADLKAAVRQKAEVTPKDKILSITTLNASVTKCLDNPKIFKKNLGPKETIEEPRLRKDQSGYIQKTFKDAEKFYEKGYKCIVDKFGSASENKSTIPLDAGSSR